MIHNSTLSFEHCPGLVDGRHTLQATMPTVLVRTYLWQRTPEMRWCIAHGFSAGITRALAVRYSSQAVWAVLVCGGAYAGTAERQRRAGPLACQQCARGNL